MPVREPTSPVLAHELRETIGRLVRRLRAEPGPSVGRLAVLGRLDRDGPASISDLAGRERMRPQSMAQTVHDLESAGLVSRRPDPADGCGSSVSRRRPDLPPNVSLPVWICANDPKSIMNRPVAGSRIPFPTMCPSGISRVARFQAALTTTFVSLPSGRSNPPRRRRLRHSVPE